MEKKSTNNHVKRTPEELKEMRRKNLRVGGPGRPKGVLNYNTRVNMAMAVLAQKYVDEMNKKNKGKRGYIPLTVDDVDIEGDIFAQHINKARNGDRHFIDSFLDRRFGKATQPIQHSGDTENPVVTVEMQARKEKLLKWQKQWEENKKK